MPRHISVTVGSIEQPPSGQVPGWLRTAANTGLAALGLDAGDLTTYSGSHNVSANQTRKIFNMAFQPLFIGAGVTLDECQINTQADPGVYFVGAGAKLTNSDVIVTGGDVQKVGLAMKWEQDCTDFFVSNVRISGSTVHIWADPPGVIEDVYAYNQPASTGADVHRDGFTRRDGDNPLTLRRCRFVCDQNSTTGAFFIQSTFGGNVGNVTVTECSFEGTGYNATIEDASGMVFNDNRFRSYSANGGTGFGPATNAGSTFTTWTDNYNWADSPPLYRGSLVGQP